MTREVISAPWFAHRSIGPPATAYTNAARGKSREDLGEWARTTFRSSRKRPLVGVEDFSFPPERAT